RPYEPEVPADTEQDERQPELPQRDPGKRHDAASDEENEARRNDALLAETCDQVAGKEARAEHGYDMPGDAEGRLIRRKAAAHHGKRSPSHYEAHQRERSDATEEGGEKARARDDLHERPGRLALLMSGGGCVVPAQVQEGEDYRTDRRQAYYTGESTGEHHRRKKLARIDRHLRADNSGKDTAAHDHIT